MEHLDPIDAFRSGRRRILFWMRLASAAQDTGTETPYVFSDAARLPTPTCFYVESVLIVIVSMLLKTLLMAADVVESSAASWSSTLFQILPMYNDLASQRAALAALRIALRNETFLRTFAATLLRTDGSKLSRQESFMLFLWSSAAIEALQLPAAMKAANKLMERQACIRLP